MRRINRRAFLAELERLGGTLQGALDWIDAAEYIGLDAHDTPLSVARLCIDDELAALEFDDPRAVELRAALKAGSQ